MQQFAALDGLLMKHPEWADKVVGLMINQDGSAVGLDSCGAAGSLPVLQDAAGSPMWGMLGGVYNSLVIVDEQGKIAHRIDPVDYPEDELEIEGVVNALLE